MIGLADSSGQVAATYTYDEWGNILSRTGNVRNPYLYAGYRYDDEIGVYYLIARYYDPVTGRMLSEDPVEGVKDKPQTQNPYVYAVNNPVNYVDPDGKFAFVIPMGYGLYCAAVALTTSYYTYRVVQTYKDYKVYSKGGKQRIRDSGLSNKSNQEIRDLARDKSLSSKERQRYIKEEKARGSRNKKKR